MAALSQPIVLLHGILGSRRCFEGLEKRLRGAPLRATTFSFDLLGFGTNKRARGGFGTAQQLAHISASIEDRFPSRDLVLIGHSLGGVLALAWTARNPGRVAKLVLLNTPLGEDRNDLTRSLLASRPNWGSILLEHRHWAHLSCILLRGARLMRLLRPLKPSYVPGAVFDDYIAHTWKSVQQTFEGVLLSTPALPLLRQIREIPVLHLTGVDDDAISRRAVAQDNVQNVSLPGGHLMLLERPDQTAVAIERFLMGTASRHDAGFA